MDEYICLTVLSRPQESESSFKSRLSQFWTHMLRNHEDDFERVYAETTEFEEIDGCHARQYLAELVIADKLEVELKAAQLDHEPIDREELFSKYEAVPPEWMQIEH